MKKIIFLLLMPFISMAQIPAPKSTTTFSNISATGNLTVTGNAKISGSANLTSSTTIGTGTVAANTSSLGIVRIKQGSSWIDFGESNSRSSIWLSKVPSTSNYDFSSDGTNNYINSQNNLSFAYQANDRAYFRNTDIQFLKPVRIGALTVPSATLDVTGTMSVSGTSTLTGAVETKTINNSSGNLSLNSNGNTLLQSYGTTILTAYPNNVVFSPAPGNATGIPYLFNAVNTHSNAASTNVPAFKVIGATRGWLTGAISTQYENHFTAPTYTAAGASTITTAAGLYVAKPIMGTNMTATNIYGIATDGAIGSTSKTDGIGYAVGSGSTVTQATSRTTGVTINAVTGAITLVSAAGSTSWQSFTVTNSAVAATDNIIINQKSGTDLNEIHITAVAAGSFNVSFKTTGGTTTEQPVFNFAVIKGQTN